MTETLTIPPKVHGEREDSLSPRERELLHAVQRLSVRTGCTPTYREIADAIQVASPSTVHRIVSRLIDKGFITKPRHYSRRSLTIARPTHCAHCGHSLDHGDA